MTWPIQLSTLAPSRLESCTDEDVRNIKVSLYADDILQRIPESGRFGQTAAPQVPEWSGLVHNKRPDSITRHWKCDTWSIVSESSDAAITGA